MKSPRHLVFLHAGQLQSDIVKLEHVVNEKPVQWGDRFIVNLSHSFERVRRYRTLFEWKGILRSASQGEKNEKV